VGAQARCLRRLSPSEPPASVHAEHLAGSTAVSLGRTDALQARRVQQTFHALLTELLPTCGAERWI